MNRPFHYLSRALSRAALAAACIAALALPAWNAQAQAWPTKTVRIIVPTPAGGPGDVVARGAGQFLNQALGQAFIVENRLGTGSIVGAQACAKSPPDGYTLCSMDSFTLTLNPHVRLSLPYDPQKDFTGVFQFGFLKSSMSVHPSVPANSVEELLALAKAKPNGLAWGTFGPASSSHFYVEWLKSTKGIQFLNVPYKAASEAMQRMVAGDIQVVTFSLGQSLALAKAGKIRILAVAGDARSPLLPDVPSFKEAGWEFSIQTWFGLFAPSATPAPIVQRLHAELVKLVPTPPFRDKFLTTQGIEMSPPAGGSMDAFAAYIRDEREMYGRLVKIVGIKPE